MNRKDFAGIMVTIGFFVWQWGDPQWPLELSEKTKSIVAAVGCAILAIGWLWRFYKITGFNIEYIKYLLKPCGLAVHYKEYINIGGSVDDLRLVMFVAHIHNRTKHTLKNLSGSLENCANREVKPSFINIDGNLRPIASVSQIEPWEKFRVMIPFGEQKGLGLDQNAHPPVEVGLQKWGDMVFIFNTEKYKIKRKFTAREVWGEANSALNAIRFQQYKQNKKADSCRTLAEVRSSRE